MEDPDLLALCLYMEAGGEQGDGQAAVARIIKNRMRRRFMSDGTVKGTVLAKDQFSWAWFAFVQRHTGNAAADKNQKAYIRIAHTLSEAEKLAEDLKKLTVPRIYNKCGSIATAVMIGTYRGEEYDRLTDDAVSYLNPRILTKLPKWATPDRLVCSVGRHDFYRAQPLPAPLTS